ncbi:MAG: hypothetical protein HY235_03135 [Acidobacteria bacterium]|nr:hypothetical protein [Acidobacteriota bacterium]
MRFPGTLAALVLAGCGYVGDPQPPALHIPQPIQDLNAVQRGDKLVLVFTLPGLTTEGLKLDRRGEIEVRVGPPPAGGFDVNVWAASARRIPAVESNANGTLTVEAPVREYSGREVFSAVRVANWKGRWSQWSNVAALAIVEPLARPGQMTAAAAADGVRLRWQGESRAVNYRIYRLAQKEDEFRLLGQADQAAYTDSTAQFGALYRYQVQAALKSGEKEAESELSEIVEITPQDTFPPAVPQGLSVLQGVSTVELAWERNTEADFRGYHVYRSTGDGPFERVGTLSESPAYSDKTVEPGRIYRYAVTAVDQKGNESARSDPVSIALPQ